MRIFKTSGFGWIGPFIFLSAIVSGHLLAQEDEPVSTTQAEEPAVTTPDKGTTEEEIPTVGVGKFFKLPFHVSISVRGGYDDNVLSQSDEFRQGSVVPGIAPGNHLRFR